MKVLLLLSTVLLSIVDGKLIADLTFPYSSYTGRCKLKEDSFLWSRTPRRLRLFCTNNVAVEGATTRSCLMVVPTEKGAANYLYWDHLVRVEPVVGLCPGFGQTLLAVAPTLLSRGISHIRVSGNSLCTNQQITA